jgi:hypothetical protein
LENLFTNSGLWDLFTIYDLRFTIYDLRFLFSEVAPCVSGKHLTPS